MNEDGKRRILVVDDEEGVVQLLTDILGGAGYEVGSASNAAEALERVRQEIYDAAILDFRLPDMDGVMLHRELRQMDPELAGRVLFTSGLVQSEDSVTYYEAYGKGFLPKPFRVPDLLAALRNLWNDA